jgi:hypothetical protein
MPSLSSFLMPTARTVPELLAYHDRSVVALRVLDGAIDTLAEVDRSRFPRRREAVVDALEEMRDELDHEVVLAIIASAERMLRLDFLARLGGTQAAATRFGLLETRFDGRVPLEEIVDVWKDIATASSECGAFKQMYNYRHGLAHGRYFNKSGLHNARPKDASDVVCELFDRIRQYTADFPQP